MKKQREVSKISLDSHFKTVLSVTGGPGYALLPIELEETRLKNYFQNLGFIFALHYNKYLTPEAKITTVSQSMAQEQGSPASTPVGASSTEGAAKVVFTETQIEQLADVFIEHTRYMREKIRGYWQFAAFGTVGIACLSAVALTLLYNWAYHEVARQFIGPAAQGIVFIAYCFAGGAGSTHFGGTSMPNLTSDPIGGAIALAGVVLVIAGGAIATLWIEVSKSRDKLIDDTIISITDHMVRQCERITRAPSAEVSRV